MYSGNELSRAHSEAIRASHCKKALQKLVLWRCGTVFVKSALLGSGRAQLDGPPSYVKGTIAGCVISSLRHPSSVKPRPRYFFPDFSPVHPRDRV
jgi:hypothetical protein